jgi:beta-galactosidase
MRIDWNEGWLFSRIGDEKSARIVSLPHDAMLGEKRSPECPGGTNNGWFEGHDYVYEKRFPLSAFEGKNLVLELEGAYHSPEIHLNGKLAAKRENGYLPLFAELAPDFGRENIIRVVTRNSDQPIGRLRQ